MPTPKYLIIKQARDPWIAHPISFVITHADAQPYPDSTNSVGATRLPCNIRRRVFALHANQKHLSIAIHRSEEKEKHRMRPNKAHSPTAELNRQVIASLAPEGVIRRASAVAPQQTEPVPVWTTPKKRTAHPPTPVLLFIGFILGLVLIFLGIQVMTWVNEVSTHWHGGDSYVTALDADVGHGGTSHFLAFYQNGAVIVVECSSDYSSTHAYTVPVHAKGTDHHAVSLDPQVIDGRRDLLVTLDDGTGSILYNTGDGMSFTQP